MERAWTSRLRWRLRGAWLSPALVVLTVGDAVLIHLRPLAGEGRTELVAGLLLASFLNLVAVAALAPFAGMALRRVRPDLPRVVARDYVGAVLVALVTVGLVAGGVRHHGTLERNREALAEAHVRAQAWLGARAPAEFRRHVALADTVPVVAGSVYRTCAPGARPERAWCVVVELDRPPASSVTLDGATPNAVFQAGRE
jgi:hypothetical protein